MSPTWRDEMILLAFFFITGFLFQSFSIFCNYLPMMYLCQVDTYYYKVPSLSAAAILGHFDIVALILSSKKCNVDKGNSSVSHSLHSFTISILRFLFFIVFKFASCNKYFIGWRSCIVFCILLWSSWNCWAVVEAWSRCECDQ